MSRVGALTLVVGIFVVLPLVVGCEQVPYRVQLGRKKDRGTPTEAAPPPPVTYAPPSADAIYLSWRTLHRDLVRHYEERPGSRAPIPVDAFARCRRALTRLGQVSAAEGTITDAIARYEEIERDAALPSSIALRRLRQLERDIQQALQTP